MIDISKCQSLANRLRCSSECDPEHQPDPKRCFNCCFSDRDPLSSADLARGFKPDVVHNGVGHFVSCDSARLMREAASVLDEIAEEAAHG